MTPPAYEHRHFGTVIVAILLPAVLLCGWGALQAEDSGIALRVILWTVTIILLLALLLFWRLVVRVDASEVRVSFGFGWPGRALAMGEIEGAAAVRRSWLWGYGLRWTPSGWLWRVSGLRAVEVRRKERKNFYIGTDEPGALVEAIEAHRTAPAA